MKGQELIGQITEAVGLPDDLVTAEIEAILLRSGKSREDITLEDFRELVADYLQDIILATLEERTKQC